MTLMNANRFRRRPLRRKGFTLLEVLVAMAIISLGMVAVFTGLNQTLSVTDRLRAKTLAGWVALNQINELQISGEYPDTGRRRDEIEMANAEWAYEIRITDFPDLDLKRLDVAVSYADTPDDVLTTVVGFIGPQREQSQSSSQNQNSGGNTEQPPAAPEASFGDGWEPPQLDTGEVQ